MIKGIILHRINSAQNQVLAIQGSTFFELDGETFRVGDRIFDEKADKIDADEDLSVLVVRDPEIVQFTAYT